MKLVTSAILALTFMLVASDTQRMSQQVNTDTDISKQTGIVFRNVNVFDGQAPFLWTSRRVTVVGNAIHSVLAEEDIENDKLELEQNVDFTFVNGNQRTLMPGLIDSHWHSTLCPILTQKANTLDIGYIHAMATVEAEKTLLRGFTTVRDAGGPAFGLKMAIDEGSVNGPRIYPSGALISQTAGHADGRGLRDYPKIFGSPLSYSEYNGMIFTADGPSEVLAAVRQQLRLGATQIKLTLSGGVASVFDQVDDLQFTAEEIRAATATAADAGTYVMSHVYTAAGIKRAIDNGVRSIEHGHLMDEETMKYIKEKDVWLSTQAFHETQDHKGFSTEQLKKEMRVNNGTARIMRWAKKYGVKVVYGTDKVNGPQVCAQQADDLLYWTKFFTNVEVSAI
eukprot:CFRG0211T1